MGGLAFMTGLLTRIAALGLALVLAWRWRHARGRRLWIFLAVAASILWLGIFLCHTREHIRIATFDCGKERRIDLLIPGWGSDEFLDLGWNFPRYSVSAHGVTIVDPTHFAADFLTLADTLSFEQSQHTFSYRALTAQQGDLVAIVAEEVPYQIFVLHDFSANMSYPMIGSGNPNPPDSFEPALKVLENAHPELNRALSFTNSTYLSIVSHLDLSHTRISDNDLVALDAYSNISELSLSWTNIGDVGLKRLGNPPFLRTLKLDYSPGITDNSVPILKHMRLEHLWIAGTSISRAGAEELKRTIPEVDWYGRE
jgi:hypothetical protein